jgi:hypothetical protein
VTEVSITTSAPERISRRYSRIGEIARLAVSDTRSAQYVLNTERAPQARDRPIQSCDRFGSQNRLDSAEAYRSWQSQLASLE